MCNTFSYHQCGIPLKYYKYSLNSTISIIYITNFKYFLRYFLNIYKINWTESNAYLIKSIILIVFSFKMSNSAALNPLNCLTFFKFKGLKIRNK